MGNNQKFIDGGAQVIALDALKTRMASDPRTKDIPGLPTITFAKDYDLKFGGTEVQAHSHGRGHTGDDTMGANFPDSRVVMVSDQITDNTPIVDFANGGSAVEWTQILDGVLKLHFEMAIPGRGEPKPRRMFRLSARNSRPYYAAPPTRSRPAPPGKRSLLKLRPTTSAGNSIHNSTANSTMNSRRNEMIKASSGATPPGSGNASGGREHRGVSQGSVTCRPAAPLPPAIALKLRGLDLSWLQGIDEMNFTGRLYFTSFSLQ